MNGSYMFPDIYGYEHYVETPTAATDVFGIAGVMLGIFVVFYFAVLAFGIVCYILQSLGIYAVAKRRGINNPWLAWLPVGSSWILGSISDQYQYVAKGRVRNRRKVLMGLEIALYLLLVPMLISFAAAIIGIVSDSAAGAGIGILVLILSDLALIVLSIVLLVFFYIALYDLYTSSEPSNATTYLVLSILFNITQPFFIFFSRKKDLGMPPRREEAQPAPQPYVQPAYQPAQQPVLPEVEQAPVVEEAPAIVETTEETE